MFSSIKYLKYSQLLLYFLVPTFYINNSIIDKLDELWTETNIHERHERDNPIVKSLKHWILNFIHLINR